MIIKDIMTTDVVSIDAGQTATAACEVYKDRGVGCLVVTQNSIIVGILTERDIIERIILGARDPNATLVEDIMSRDIKTIHALAPIENAIKIMKEQRLKKLPVILNGKIVGIVTIADINNRAPQYVRC
jgi:CBS domain-containing protein